LRGSTQSYIAPLVASFLLTAKQPQISACEGEKFIFFYDLRQQKYWEAHQARYTTYSVLPKLETLDIVPELIHKAPVLIAKNRASHSGSDPLVFQMSLFQARIF
jgi:hypothetical protein